MPEPATTRLGLYRPASDGSELVDVQQDLNDNWAKIDDAAGFQVVTSTTRPSTPYAGKAITESDTSYRTYFHNGSSPASAGYVQIPNASSTFDADLDLAAGRQVNIGGSAETSALAVKLTSSTDFVLTSRVGSETQPRVAVNASGDLTWGSGAAASDVTLARTAPARLALTGSSAALGIGSAYMRPQLAVQFTVANTTTESLIGGVTIPANDTVPGAVYRVIVYGFASVTGAPTFTIRARHGGTSGTLAGTIGPVTASSGVTNQTWSCEFDMICMTSGASGTWAPRLVCQQNVSAASAQTGTVLLPTSGANTITRDTTTGQDMVLTWQWSTASASNTVTARGFGRRIA